MNPRPPLTSEQYAILVELHARAEGLQGPELERLIADACRSDAQLTDFARRMLSPRAHDRSVLDDPALGPEFTLLTPGAFNASGGYLGSMIGGCTIVSLIHDGPGGMVFEALQHEPQRTVAIKVLPQGAWSSALRRRFAIEADILGRLEHPHIARVYQSGVTPSPPSPYFVMEHVPGARPITHYCAELHLDTCDRLGLFLQVCDAAHHGHQKGVIHRDLKPSNILVNSDADAKVIDFGVARLVDHEAMLTTLGTSMGEIVGTIPYMSPEQCVGDPLGIDIRTDVYSLGAVLYELLCGRPPHDVGQLTPTEALAKVRAATPPRPASIAHDIEADLETIVLKAIDPEKERRYQSADELGQDIRRYLAHQPIAARPATLMYQLRKLARRNRAAFAAAGITLAVLVGASIFSTLLAYRAETARRKAERALADSSGVSDYLLDLFLDSPDEAQLDRFQLLARAEARLAENPIQDVRVDAKIREYIGHGYLKLGAHSLAEPYLTVALARRRSLGIEDADFAKCLHLVSMLHLAMGRVAEGASLLEETLRVRRSLYGNAHMATHPDSELLYFVVEYLPNAPETRAEFQRRGELREQTPVALQAPADLPLLFADDFDGASIGPAWSVELHESLGWTHQCTDSRLVVTDIEPVRHPDVYDQGVWTAVRLVWTPPAPLSRFRVEATVGWDTGDRPDAVQFATLMIFGKGRRMIALAQFSDQSMQSGPQRTTGIGHDGGAHYTQSGPDTLPSHGSAQLTIERAQDQVTIYWDGHVLQRGRWTEPLTDIAFQFQWTQVYNLNGSSTFGTEWIDSVRVFGSEPAPR